MGMNVILIGGACDGKNLVLHRKSLDYSYTHNHPITGEPITTHIYRITPYSIFNGDIEYRIFVWTGLDFNNSQK